MVKTMEQSNNMRLQYITKLSIISAKSIIGSDMRILCRRLKLDNISQLMNIGSCMREKTYIQECTVEDHIALMVIQELRSCMSGTYFTVFVKLMLLLNIYVYSNTFTINGLVHIHTAYYLHLYI